MRICNLAKYEYESLDNKGNAVRNKSCSVSVNFDRVSGFRFFETRFLTIMHSKAIRRTGCNLRAVCDRKSR